MLSRASVSVVISSVFIASIALASDATIPLPATGEQTFQWLDRLLLLLGRLHPSIVHFPVALILVTGGIELWGTLKKEQAPSSVGVMCLLFGAFAAILACVLGWINASHQQFFGSLERVLFIHRWGGVAVAVTASFAFLFGARVLRNPHKRLLALYRTMVVAGALLVGASAHYGGMMVHGEEYFAEVFEGTPIYAFLAPVSDSSRASLSADFMKTALPPPSNKAVSFKTDVLPIFQETCSKCHLGGKRKGQFRMDTRELALKGGKTGQPGFIPGDSQNSYLVELISGLDPKSVMPNKGRKLTDAEVSIIRKWIDDGGHWEDTGAKVHSFEKASLKPKKVSLPIGGSPEHPIDRLLGSYFKQHGVELPPVVDDRLFARRVYLDIVGSPPSPEELKDFLTNRGKDKRKTLVKALLDQDDRYAGHWLTFWNDLLRNGYTGPGFLHGGRREITYWLHSALVNNMPYDKFVSELVSPKNNLSVGFTRGILWWKNPEDVNPNEHPAMQASQNVGQVFLGINMKCASCHDSFTDAWTLEDAFGLANVFAEQALEVHECNEPLGEFVKARFVFPELGEIVSPKTEVLEDELAALTQKKDLKLERRVRRKKRLYTEARQERTQALAQMLTSTENGRFARTLVNRFWAKLLGRGIIEPLDEMDSAAWNQELLDWLAYEFAFGGYDMKKLLELIMTSQVYQLPSQPAKESYGADEVFKGPVVRRISAEQFLDTLRLATDVWPEAKIAELNRVMRIARRDFTPTSSFVKAGKPGPRVRFESEQIGGELKTQVIDVDVSGAKSVWLAVIPKHKVKSALEKLAERHAKAQGEVEATALPEIKEVEKTAVILRGKLHLAGNAMRRVIEAVNINRSANVSGYPERAIWGDPHFVSGKGARIDLDTVEWRLASSQYEKVDLVSDGSVQIAGGEPVTVAIASKPVSVVRYKLPSEGVARFRAQIGLDRELMQGNRQFTFLVMTDLRVRSAFLENTDLMWTLGRPKREQAMSSRPTAASTMQALELTNGSAFANLLKDCAKQLKREKWNSSKQLVSTLFLRLLGRAPSVTELRAGVELVGRDLSLSGVQDFLWGISMLPEFQLIT